MNNSELKNNEVGSGLDNCISHKHPPISTKKMVLTDVQNENRVSQNHRKSSFPTDGGPITDKLKISGTKRLIPESPASHPFRSLPDCSATKEHLVYTSKKFGFVQENGKTEHNTDRNVSIPLLKPYRNMQQEIPQKQTPVLDGPAENDCFKVTSKVTDSRRVDDRKWEERYIHLQNFLKMCDDESICRDHVQKLRHLSPAELSIYAVELERRAIQLTIEEGKELQRMKALKILEKSATTVNPLPKGQPSESKK